MRATQAELERLERNRRAKAKRQAEIAKEVEAAWSWFDYRSMLKVNPKIQPFRFRFP